MRGIFGGMAASRRKSASLESGAWYPFIGSVKSTTGVAINQATAMRNSTVFACVNIIGEDVARAEPKLYRTLPDRKLDDGRTAYGGREQVADHWLARLFKRPNRVQDWYQFASFMERSVQLKSNAYAVILPDARGNPAELIPMNPDKTVVLESVDGGVFYQFSPTGLFELSIFGQLRNAYEGFRVPSASVFHMHELGFNMLIGSSRIGFAAEPIGLALGQEQQAGRWLANGAMPSTVLTTDGKLTDQAAKRIKGDWEQMAGGLANTGKTVVLEQGLKPEKLTFSSVDLEFLSSRGFQVEDILRFYRMPPHKVAKLDRCMPSDTLVYTKCGPKRIVDVSLGEKVWSYDGASITLATVASRFENGTSQVLEIRTTNRRVRCTATHRLLVRRAHLRDLRPGEVGGRNVGGKKKRLDWREEWVAAGDLIVGDVLVTLDRIPASGKQTAPNGRLLTEGFMEFCGLLVGDGNVLRQNGRPSHVSIARANTAKYMPHYREVMQAEFERFDGGNGRGNSALVARAPITLTDSGRSTKFASALAATELTVLGFAGTAFTKRVPGWVFALREDLRLAFLRGFLDADGSVDKKGRISFYSANKALLDDIRHLAMGCGVPVTNSRYDDQTSLPPGAKGPVQTRMWRFTCSDPGANARIGSRDPRYIERIASGKPFGRKGRSYPNLGGDGFTVDGAGLSRIVKISDCGAEPVFDIEVAGTHAFIADGVVSHNSTNNNIEAQDADYVNNTLAPKFTRWERRLEYHFELDRAGLTVDFDISDLFRASPTARMLTARQGVSGSIFTQNEARRHYDQNLMPVADGDRLLEPTNMAAAGSQATGGAPDDAGRPPKEDPQD